MSDRREVWSSQRPVLNSLPANGYQNNEPTNWVTSWVDQELTGVATRLQEFYKQIDADLAPPEMLDYLAWLVGLSGRYWDVQWSELVKRRMIKLAYQLINQAGTLDAVRLVLDAHEIPYDIWVDGSLRLPFNLPGTFGQPKLRFYLRVPLSILRDGKDWREAERTIRNYNAAVVNGKVTFKAFFLSYSTLGDPVFKAS